MMIILAPSYVRQDEYSFYFQPPILWCVLEICVGTLRNMLSMLNTKSTQPAIWKRQNPRAGALFVCQIQGACWIVNVMPFTSRLEDFVQLCNCDRWQVTAPGIWKLSPNDYLRLLILEFFWLLVMCIAPLFMIFVSQKWMDIHALYDICVI